MRCRRPGIPGLLHRIGPSLGLGQTYLAGPAVFAASAAIVLAIGRALRWAKDALRAAANRWTPAPG
mgnify:CR=1 FL=1